MSEMVQLSHPRVIKEIHWLDAFDQLIPRLGPLKRAEIEVLLDMAQATHNSHHHVVTRLADATNDKWRKRMVYMSFQKLKELESSLDVFDLILNGETSENR
jgi:hypothetical protein